MTDVNDKQKVVMFPIMKQHFGGDLKGQKIAVWGLFKPETDDIRQAPSLDILEKLIEAGADLTKIMILKLWTTFVA